MRIFFTREMSRRVDTFDSDVWWLRMTEMLDSCLCDWGWKLEEETAHNHKSDFLLSGKILCLSIEGCFMCVRSEIHRKDFPNANISSDAFDDVSGRTHTLRALGDRLCSGCRKETSDDDRKTGKLAAYKLHACAFCHKWKHFCVMAFASRIFSDAACVCV